MYREQAIMVDLDSTLADTRHRQTMIEKTPPEARTTKFWVRYSMKAAADEPIEGNIALVNLLTKHNHTIYITTGRSIEAIDITKDWLMMNSVYYDHLLMRPVDCRLGNDALKEEFIKMVKMNNHQPILAIDDWPDIAKMYATHGIPCVLVQGPTLQPSLEH